MIQRRSAKEAREREVLLGLVELFLETGKPVGSNTLKENGFENLSSATIRNYFANLENQGFLKQQHSSGGRIPTGIALKLYAQTHIASSDIDEGDALCLTSQLNCETREVAGYLQHASELLSELTQTAVFVSSPRFDQDFITNIKLVNVDNTRTLAVILTDFGLVLTEVLFWPEKINPFSLKRLESYFTYRLSGLEKVKLTPEELKIGEHFYNEIFLRHIVKYSSFYSEDLYKTGFSKLLNYPELRDAKILTSSLAFFENPTNINALLKDCYKKNALCVWIEEDLSYHISQPVNCSIIAIPYMIHNKPVGTIALLGPSRIPYKRLFGLIRHFSQTLSDNLTNALYKHKITFREPKDLNDSQHYLGQAKCLLLEDQS